MYIHHDQRHHKVAEAKILMWLFYGIGIPVWLFALYVNIDTWKSNVLFIAGLLTLGLNAYYKIRRNEQAIKKEKQESILRDIEIENKKSRK